MLTYRRRLMWSFAILAVAGSLAGGVTWMILADLPARGLAALDRSILQGMASAGLTVDEVVVVGRVETSRADIARALGVRRGDPILRVDIQAARLRLEKLGWVQGATITRRLPGDLHVHLKERRPFALWQKNGRLVLIDRNGAPITSKGLERFAALPVVVGRGAPQHVGALFDALGAQPQLFARVAAVVRIADRRWDIRFANGIVARLPEANAAQGWRRLADLEAKHNLLGRDLVAIDLRLADRLIVRLSVNAAKRRRQPGKNT
jgi:cell division protein FtsQ